MLLFLENHRDWQDYEAEDSLSSQADMDLKLGYGLVVESSAKLQEISEYDAEPM